LVYAFPHVGCQVKNDNANKQYQDVNNPHIHRDGGEVPPPRLPIENDNKEQLNKNTMSTTNLAKEIQKLIQHIEAEYQKGIDYKAINLSKPKETGIEHIIQILSPQLKKACRQKFNFPSNANYHLDYEEGDQEGNDFFYRLGINKNDYDFLSYGGKNLYRSNGIEEPKKCKSCEELTLYENGRIVE